MLILLVVIFAAILAAAFFSSLQQQIVPISVNYHLTRQCNYSCQFCFHTATSSFVLPLEEAKRGLLLLKEAGTKKINFAGGEPFLQPKFLGELCKYAKENCDMAVSIVSNGSKITKTWMDTYGTFVDIIAISCDSFDEATNIRIGRGNGRHIENLLKISDWCKKTCIKFKINTVVNSLNWQEDMNEQIKALDPFRWKVFQVLLVYGENDQRESINDLLITEDKFDAFCDRHMQMLGHKLVKENNKDMRSSYLLLDERMCFLDCSQMSKVPSRSILDVGVRSALKSSGFDQKTFVKRDGIYDYRKSVISSDPPAGSRTASLDW
jgi:radical S-adenosyl methionine domain-containing protein 2